MIVELLCRYTKEIDEQVLAEIDEQLDTEELIKGDTFNRGKERSKLLKKYVSHEYGPFIFNMLDIFSINYVDKDHVHVRFDNDTAFTFKIEYEYFRGIYQSLLGLVVNDFTDMDALKTEFNNGQ